MVEQDREVTAALAKGGMWSEVAPDPAKDAGGLAKYSAWRDPAGAERLGKMLAASAASLDATSILLHEEEPTDLVLAHIVGRELGLTVARAFNRDGLVEVTGGITPGERVLILADAIREERMVDALRAAVDRAQSSITGFVVLVQTRALAAKAMQAPVQYLAREPADG